MYRFENLPMPEGPPTVAIVRKERVGDVIVPKPRPISAWPA